MPAYASIPGGRAAAERALATIDPATYTRSRNFLDGAVSRLSPYLRHGVLTLAEVRDHALTSVRGPEEAEKFIQELAWRDYWQRLYYALGDGIWRDRESYKTGFPASSYAADLPANLREGTSGLRCMDSFSVDLHTVGYLHNHARMWLAAYTVHWLRVRWQAGARWFLEHLLDGDPASNNLSWQWVASTFSHKPYFFNRENLERYTNGVYCRECPLRNGGCPFQNTYEDLEQTLFPRLHHTQEATPKPPARSAQDERKPTASPATLTRPLLWVHTDNLNPVSTLFTRHPSNPAIFVWDEDWLANEHIAPTRRNFIEQCLIELPASVKIERGNPALHLLAAARAAGADHILALRTPDPRLLAAAASVERQVPVFWLDAPAFVDNTRPFDLKRFSRYWQKAQASALRPTRRS